MKILTLLSIMFLSACAGRQLGPHSSVRSMASDGHKTPCGLLGSLQERIDECAREAGSKKHNWKLVTRTVSHEIWQSPSGLIWGDLLDAEYSHYEASLACSKTREENGNISELFFRLPSYEEFQEAHQQQMRHVLPHVPGWFWTSSKVEFDRRLRKKAGINTQLDPNGSFLPSLGEMEQTSAVRCVSGATSAQKK
jgi:hypothetical protein